MMNLSTAVQQDRRSTSSPVTSTSESVSASEEAKEDYVDIPDYMTPPSSDPTKKLREVAQLIDESEQLLNRTQAPGQVSESFEATYTRFFIGFTNCCGMLGSITAVTVLSMGINNANEVVPLPRAALIAGVVGASFAVACSLAACRRSFGCDACC